MFVIEYIDIGNILLQHKQGSLLQFSVSSITQKAGKKKERKNQLLTGNKFVCLKT